MNYSQPLVFIDETQTLNEASLAVLGLNFEKVERLFLGSTVSTTYMIPLTTFFNEAKVLQLADDFGVDYIDLLDANRILHTIETSTRSSHFNGYFGEIHSHRAPDFVYSFKADGRYFSAVLLENK